MDITERLNRLVEKHRRIMKQNVMLKDKIYRLKNEVALFHDEKKSLEEHYEIMRKCDLYEIEELQEEVQKLKEEIKLKDEIITLHEST
tara:strand:- start:332 stop:595 length:264 start_codon:yes stop_codon:yes gene_type:complete